MTTDLRTAHWQEIRDTLTGKREQVYLALCTHGPATACELAAAMGWDKTSVRPRLTELCGNYHAVETGERRNGQHVFRALSQAEAHCLWRAANPEPISTFNSRTERQLCFA